MFYLRYLYLFVHNDVQRILCCVCVLIVLVSRDCTFLIAPSLYLYLKQLRLSFLDSFRFHANIDF